MFHLKMNTLIEVIGNLRKHKNKGITFINSETEEKFISYRYLYEKSL